MRRRADLLVDVKNAVGADVERPARCERLIFVDDAIRGRNFFRGIAQQRVVHAERLRKRFVGLRRVDANREMRDVERPDNIATLTE
jgi:hypothetical protein